MRLFGIAIGGAAGALSRYGLDMFIDTRGRGAFPWGIFVVNVTGCFVLGVLATLFAEKYLGHPVLRPSLTVGFLGAYTTFSTFALQSVDLADGGAYAVAAANVVASVAAGLLAVWIGIQLAKVF